tara:strand:+ start:51 stop:242 length:192 start_codon:yes stop_codon:yes gene_type:complete
MVWHIKKTGMIGSTVYYQGSNRWTDTFANRLTYTSQAKAKAENYIWEKKKDGWDVTAINENAS